MPANYYIAQDIDCQLKQSGSSLPEREHPPPPLRKRCCLIRSDAWYLADAEGQSWPVRMLKPNPFGLFDIYGDAWEWLQDRRINYPEGSPNTTIDMEDAELLIANGVPRTRRGGSWSYDTETTRSAHRGVTIYILPRPTTGQRGFSNCKNDWMGIAG